MRYILFIMLGLFAVAANAEEPSLKRAPEEPSCRETLHTSKYRDCLPADVSHTQLKQQEEAALSTRYGDQCEAPCELYVKAAIVQHGECTKNGVQGRYLTIFSEARCITKPQ